MKTIDESGVRKMVADTFRSVTGANAIVKDTDISAKFGENTFYKLALQIEDKFVSMGGEKVDLYTCCDTYGDILDKLLLHCTCKCRFELTSEQEDEFYGFPSNLCNDLVRLVGMFKQDGSPTAKCCAIDLEDVLKKYMSWSR